MAMVTYGFIIGEALYPMLVAAAMGWLGWRGIWLVAAVLMLVVAMPVSDPARESACSSR